MDFSAFSGDDFDPKVRRQICCRCQLQRGFLGNLFLQERMDMCGSVCDSVDGI